MLFEYKEILGFLAAILSIALHIPYLIQTLKGTNKPHIFTWIIWTILTWIAFFGQYVGEAGPGAWVTASTGLICLIITAAACKNGEKYITQSDWIMFSLEFRSIPLWAITNTPLLSMILITTIDCSAFYPTFRKSWIKPFEENSFMYGANIPRHLISIMAISNFSIITVIYPAALLLMNAVMFIMLKIRRLKFSREIYPHVD